MGMFVGFAFMPGVLVFDIFAVNVPPVRVGMGLVFPLVRMRMFVLKRMNVSVHMLVRMAVNGVPVAVDVLVTMFMLALMLMGVGMFPFHGR